MRRAYNRGTQFHILLVCINKYLLCFNVDFVETLSYVMLVVTNGKVYGGVMKRIC